MFFFSSGSGHKFTWREARLINEFLKDPMATGKTLATKAGYSPKSAEAQFTIVMARPYIKAEIRDQLKAVVLKERLSIQRYFRHLHNITEVDKRNYLNPDGTFKSLKDLSKLEASLVTKYEVNEIFQGTGEDRHLIGYVKKIFFSDPLKSVEMLGRTMQAFVDKVEVNEIKTVTHTHRVEIDFSLLKAEELRQLQALLAIGRERTLEMRRLDGGTDETRQEEFVPALKQVEE